MNILTNLEHFINDFNTLNNTTFCIDSIRIEYQKRYKQSRLNELGNWSKLQKNSNILHKLKKRLNEYEITTAHRLEKHNIYYFNKKDTSTTSHRYDKAELVIFGMRQYHKDPPPKEMIKSILSILKNVSNIDVCLDMPFKPDRSRIEQLFKVTPYITPDGVVTSTSYINKPEITMIEKIVIYNKQVKNSLGFAVWRIEAKIIIPNIKLLALPLYEFKEIIDLMSEKQALQIAKELQQ